ncbi:MAG: ELWxxDGT repeat protein [Gammaproteobacteria bacterium]
MPGNNGSYVNSIIEVDSTLYFSAFNDLYGNELWKSDGTASGTILVSDINKGNESSNPQYLTYDGKNVSAKQTTPF